MCSLDSRRGQCAKILRWLGWTAEYVYSVRLNNFSPWSENGPLRSIYRALILNQTLKNSFEQKTTRRQQYLYIYVTRLVMNPSPLRLEDIIHLDEPTMTAFLNIQPSLPPHPAPKILDEHTSKCSECRQLGHQRQTCPNLPCLYCSLMRHSLRNCHDLAVLAHEITSETADLISTEGKFDLSGSKHSVSNEVDNWYIGRILPATACLI